MTYHQAGERRIDNSVLGLYRVSARFLTTPNADLFSSRLEGSLPQRRPLHDRCGNAASETADAELDASLGSHAISPRLPRGRLRRHPERHPARSSSSRSASQGKNHKGDRLE